MDPKILYFTFNNFMNTIAVVRHVNSLIKKREITIELGTFCNFKIISCIKLHVS